MLSLIPYQPSIRLRINARAILWLLQRENVETIEYLERPIGYLAWITLQGHYWGDWVIFEPLFSFILMGHRNLIGLHTHRGIPMTRVLRLASGKAAVQRHSVSTCRTCQTLSRSTMPHGSRSGAYVTSLTKSVLRYRNLPG